MIHIRYCNIEGNQGCISVYYEDLIKHNINALPGYPIWADFEMKYYMSINGIFLGIVCSQTLLIESIGSIKYKLIEELIISPNHLSNRVNNHILANGISRELQKLQSTIICNLESNYNKKFNDLLENTSYIIKELKQDLEIKNEKLRSLELKVHYLESQIDKKVNVDYEYIKQKNKKLNTDFNRVAKLMKLGNY